MSKISNILFFTFLLCVHISINANKCRSNLKGTLSKNKIFSHEPVVYEDEEKGPITENQRSLRTEVEPALKQKVKVAAPITQRKFTKNSKGNNETNSSQQETEFIQKKLKVAIPKKNKKLGKYRQKRFELIQKKLKVALPKKNKKLGQKKNKEIAFIQNPTKFRVYLQFDDNTVQLPIIESLEQNDDQSKKKKKNLK
jgi:hypothetical protein